MMKSIYLMRDMKYADMELPYVIKYGSLIELIHHLMQSGEAEAIDVTTQRAFGDNEKEFRESMKRISEAELYVIINGTVYHPLDLPMLAWAGR